MRGVLLVLLLSPLSAFPSFEANGVALGEPESEVRENYPSAHCRPLEWESLAADRRCDDSRASFGGVGVRVTFYLKKDAVQAFDVRFGTRDLESLVAFLKTRYGAPASETRDAAERKGARHTYRALWERNGARAVLVAQLEKRTGSLLVYRGNFEEEIYRVR